MKKNKNLDGLDEINVYYGLTVLVLSFKRRFLWLCQSVMVSWTVVRQSKNQCMYVIKKKECT